MTRRADDSHLQPGSTFDPAGLIGQRWFAAPARPIRSIVIDERFDFAGGGALLILRVDVEAGAVLWRSMPIESADGRSPWLGLLDLVVNQAVLRGAMGSTLAGSPEPDWKVPAAGAVRPLGKDQSHTSVVVNEAILVKLYRALAPGMNTEIELGQALGPVEGAPVPRYRGAVSLYRSGSDGRTERVVLAFVQDFVPEAGDAFEELADRLAAWLRAGAPPRALPSLVVDATPAGHAVARLHAALAGIARRHFAPRPVSPDRGDLWGRGASRAHRKAQRLLRRVDPSLAAWLAGRHEAIGLALEPLGPLAAPVSHPLQRIHGDLHLGQLLRSGDGFLIADLEGEPGRSATERRRLDTPLRDLASMLRSFDHVARSGMRRSGVPLDEIAAGTSGADPAIEAWLAAIRSTFLDAYVAESAARGRVIAIEPALLRALEVEKELYEFSYAATYLPTWMYAPAAGMRWLLDHSPL